MKHLLLTTALLAASPTFAGGPVLVEDAHTAEAEAPRSGGGLVILGGLIIACAILCGGSDDAAPVPLPGPLCNTDC